VHNLYYINMLPESIALDRSAHPIDGRIDERIGLYIHIPFCAQKCPYCDFNTYAGLDALHVAYVDALCAEINRWAEPLTRRTIGTLFIGGGTPTVLAIAQLERILTTVRQSFKLVPDCEITSEANPGTVDRAIFRGLRSLGVNRLSMGVQSFQPEELAFLGRVHDVADVYAAFDAARGAGFDNVNLDFMFGLPKQSARAWDATLDAALALAPEHLSLYSLIVEPGTPLYTSVQTGQVAAPDDDDAADLYLRARERLGAVGYSQYEVSNWARGATSSSSGSREDAGPGETCDDASIRAVPTLASRHNLVYWRNQEYLGVGPGAHSHLRGSAVAAVAADTDLADHRWGNVRPVPGYIRRIGAGESVEAFREEIDPRTAMGETMMLGLRLVGEGVPFAGFSALHGRDLRGVFAAELAELADWGLIAMDGARVRLTERGLMVGNQVFGRFMAD
jgi:oxygen-independent coproporphyrinogen-3 oxidase